MAIVSLAAYCLSNAGWSGPNLSSNAYIKKCSTVSLIDWWFQYQKKTEKTPREVIFEKNLSIACINYVHIQFINSKCWIYSFFHSLFFNFIIVWLLLYYDEYFLDMAMICQLKTIRILCTLLKKCCRWINKVAIITVAFVEHY